MANQKLNTTITIGAVLGTKTSRTFGVLKGGLGQINQSIKEVTRRQKEIGREKAALLKAGKSVEHLEREYKQLENRLENLTAQQNRWTRAIGRTKDVGRSFGRMRSQLTGTFRAGAIAATIYGGAVFGVAKSTASLGDEVAKTADKLGIGTTELQELRYAGERAGLSVSDIDKSLEKMQKNLGEAMTGTGAAKDALDQLGLSADDLTKMKPDEALGLIADKMQGVGTQAERAAIANDIFGRSGIGMLNMLRDGSAGLTKLREDARKTGYVMSEEAARQSEAFNDALLDAELSAKGVKNTIGTALLPVTTGLMKQFSTWVQTNSSEIQIWGNSFGAFAERALPVLKDVVVGVGKISGQLWGTISLVSEMVGGWENFGMIIGGVFAAKTILTIGSFVGSVFKLGGALLSITKFTPLVVGGIRAIGLAIMANPIGIALAAISGAVYLVYKNFDRIKSYFSNFEWRSLIPNLDWNRIISVFSWDNVLKAANWLTWLSPIRWFDFIPGFSWNSVLSKINIGDKISKFTWSDFIGAFSWENVLKVMDWLTYLSPIKWLDFIPGFAWSDVFTKLKIKDFVGNFRWKNVLPKFSWSQIMTKLNPWNFITGRGKDKETSPQRNASGGIFGNRPMLVGERGPEMYFPNRGGYIATNEQLRRMETMARSAVARPTTSSPQIPSHSESHVYHIHVQTESSQKAREVLQEIEKQKRNVRGGRLFDQNSLRIG